MRNVSCENCGTEMDKIDDETFECPNCHSEMIWDGDDWYFEPCEELEYNDIWTDTRPAECTGCGSDMYPDCSYSCERFDD